jgi:hypothetical protein
MGLFQSPFQPPRRNTRTTTDMAFVMREWDLLMSAYRGQWIAVRGNYVVAHARDYRTFCRHLRRTRKKSTVLLLPNTSS